jgi:SAM-dependent methyltransferase
MKQTETDEIYRNVPLEEIPWNIETPPDAIVQLIEAGKVNPCRALDIGCGAGNYAIYLAGKGFDVTGIDISPKAIELATKNAAEKKVECNFIVADLLDDLLDIINKPFDFAYDWEVMHHVYPGERKKFARNIYKILNHGAKYLSVCFSDRDTTFGGSGKYRNTRLGTILYFSSEKEIDDLFRPYFQILDLKTTEISGKSVNHLVNYCFMEKK